MISAQVTDFQGTLNEPGEPPFGCKGYTLTDPCALCVNRRRFGDAEYGNLGPDFIQRNMEACCRLLGVPVPTVKARH